MSQNIELEFTPEAVRLISIGLRAVFEIAQQAGVDDDPVRAAALRVAGVAAKRFNDMLTVRRPATVMDVTWQPVQGDSELAGVLIVQPGSFGRDMLLQVLGAAHQAVVAQCLHPDRFAAGEMLYEIGGYL